MARGGRRQNAGRNPKLDILDRLAIGAECERHFNEMWVRARDALWEKREKVGEIRKAQAEFRAGSARGRERFRASDAGVELTEVIDQLVREMRKTPDFVEETKRTFHITAPRPKNVTESICVDVAARHAMRLERTDIGPRYARRCWDEYRRFEKETSPDEV